MYVKNGVQMSAKHYFQSIFLMFGILYKVNLISLTISNPSVNIRVLELRFVLSTDLVSLKMDCTNSVNKEKYLKLEKTTKQFP